MVSQIQIIVQHIPGKICAYSVNPSTLTFKVNSNSTIFLIKQLIKQKTSVPPSSQYLSFDGYHLESDKTLVDYNIKDKSKLYLVCNHSDGQYQIFVRLVNGTLFKLKISYSDIVDQVKRLIQETTGVPKDQQRIIFAGKQLEDDRIFCHYGIQKESTVHLIVREI